jgi:hypothetical protein
MNTEGIKREVSEEDMQFCAFAPLFAILLTLVKVMRKPGILCLRLTLQIWPIYIPS